MDDDAPKEWQYDGNGIPKACPLVEITDPQDMGTDNILLQKFKEFVGSQGYDLIISDSGISIKDLVESLNSMPIPEPHKKE